MRLIESQTGVNHRQLYFLLNRCLMSDADGRIVGFPDLIKYTHFAVYERTAVLQTTRDANGGDLVGAIGLLLERYPQRTDRL